MAPRGPVTLHLTFGPSRSVHFPRALTYARRYAHTLEEIEPSRWRATFTLDRDPRDFGAAGRLLEFVGSWRATEVDVDSEPERAWVVAAMCHSARAWLRAIGDCGERYWGRVPDKCFVCPLFDKERAGFAVGDYLPDNWWAGGGRN